ncbi:MAG TPA: GMC family oxidoreductase [Gammaproteobacteria bacterium]|nr:GMC family oxidoreductase [Gammaproteobacteria bacterium]
MIEEAASIPAGSAVSCEICIVGAGPAGITLALELAKTGGNIVLLEAGGLKNSGKSMELYRGELADPARHLPLDSDRYRQLGGTSALWGGRCIPFSAIDFETRDYVPHSGWPLSKEELDPYYRKAHTYCECGDYLYHTDDAMPEDPAEMIPGFKGHAVTSNTIERWSPPTHFGKTYKKALQDAPNIRVLMHAVCLSIDVSGDGTEVSSLSVGRFGRESFTIKPEVTVLCGGGLEVTRLLLASNKVHKTGLGNHSDWLGRGYMCHISGSIARVRFADNVVPIYGYELDREGIYCRRRLCISEQAQREQKLLNAYLLLDRPLLSDPEHGSGLFSLAFIAKKILQHDQTRAPFKGKYALYWRHIINILKGSPEVLSVLPRWCRNRFIQGRRIPSLLQRSKNNEYHLYYHTEQIPDRDSRITLSDKVDIFGVPRLFVDYRIAEKDVESICLTHRLIDTELRDSGCGKLVYDSDNPAEAIRDHQAMLGHHIGTTRMAARDSDGVVDENCQVHGIPNLFVASSSIFPTSGQANPTLTIVALTIRLAAHIKGTSP